MKVGKKEEEEEDRDVSLGLALKPYRNTNYLAFKAYSTCECLFHYIEFVQNTR
jgi:hypothetical protein